MKDSHGITLRILQIVYVVTCVLERAVCTSQFEKEIDRADSGIHCVLSTELMQGPGN